MQPISKKVLIFVYIVITLFMGCFAIRDILSPAGPWISSTAKDMHWDCIQQYDYTTAECLEQVVAYDISYSIVSRQLANDYTKIASAAWYNREYIRFVQARLQSVRYLTIYWMTVNGPVPWICWVIIGLYWFLYDKIPDFWEKVTEGLFAGTAVSLSMFLLTDQFVHTMLGRFDDVSRVDIPPQIFVFILIIFLSWTAPDILKRKFDTFALKILLLAAGVVIFLLLPFSIGVRYLIVPLLVIGLSIGYYYWKGIGDLRKQVAVITYTTIGIGVLAATVKHWSFLTHDIFSRTYKLADLAEFITDYIVFLLGFLLAFLEMHKTPTSQPPVPETSSSEKVVPLPTQTMLNNDPDPQFTTNDIYANVFNALKDHLSQGIEQTIHPFPKRNKWGWLNRGWWACGLAPILTVGLFYLLYRAFQSLAPVFAQNSIALALFPNAESAEAFAVKWANFIAQTLPGFLGIWASIGAGKYWRWRIFFILAVVIVLVYFPASPFPPLNLNNPTELIIVLVSIFILSIVTYGLGRQAGHLLQTIVEIIYPFRKIIPAIGGRPVPEVTAQTYVILEQHLPSDSLVRQNDLDYINTAAQAHLDASETMSLPWVLVLTVISLNVFEQLIPDFIERLLAVSLALFAVTGISFIAYHAALQVSILHAAAQHRRELPPQLQISPPATASPHPHRPHFLDWFFAHYRHRSDL